MPNHYTTEPLERGFRGTAKTIGKMHQLVALGKLDPSLQKFAYWIRASVPQDARGSGKALADAIFAWTKYHGIFTRDPFQIEKVSHPLAAMRPIIELRRAGKYRGPGLFTGDCAHFAVIVASLGGALGYQYAFETAKVDAQRPDEFSHVWAALLVGGQWYPLDSSTPGVGPGWRPQVTPANFKRWGEKPIEEVAGMSGGLGQNGNGRYVDANGYVDPQQYGYGIPKSVEPGRPANVPLAGVDGGFEMFVPEQPALARGDLEDTSPHTRKVPIPEPDARVGDYAAMVLRRPGYVPQRPYINTEREYPPGSRWRGPYKVLQEDPARPYTHFERPQRIPVERRVEFVQGTPIVAHRYERPTMKGGAMGMGQAAEDWRAGLVTTLDQPTREEAAKSTSGGIWDSITKTISSLIPSIGKAAADRTTAKYADRLASATNRVAGAPVATAGTYTAPAGAWYASPFVWLGGLLVVGGIAYVATRPSGVRRRRRNPYHFAVRRRGAA